MRYIYDFGGIKNKDGLTIKPNMLYRSSNMININSKQLEMLKSFKLKKIIDLRHEGEREHTPSYKLDGVKYINISILENNISAITYENNLKKLEMLKNMPDVVATYKSMLESEYCLSKIKEAVREIVFSDEYPINFHCSTGKDRTGVISMLILEILDVDKKHIIENYMMPKNYFLRSAYIYAFLAFLFTFDINLAKKAARFYIVHEDNIKAAYDTIEKNYGSIDCFIRDYLQISDEDKVMFKNKMLTNQ